MFIYILYLDSNSTRWFPLLYLVSNLLLLDRPFRTLIGTTTSDYDKRGKIGREMVELCVSSVWERIWDWSVGRSTGFRGLYRFESCVSGATFRHLCLNQGLTMVACSPLTESASLLKFQDGFYSS